jgi:hypothetical protein
MNENKKLDPPWVDGNLFNINRNKVPAEEILKYSGMEVAWKQDGTQIIAGAKTFEELVAKIESLGIDPSQVVFSYVPTDDESLLF